MESLLLAAPYFVVPSYPAVKLDDLLAACASEDMEGVVPKRCARGTASFTVHCPVVIANAASDSGPVVEQSR